VLGARFGVFAVDMVKNGKFARMAALHGNSIEDVDLGEAVGKLKGVDLEFFEVAEVFFG
jgi:6-phosphofructokinase 1